MESKWLKLYLDMSLSLAELLRQGMATMMKSQTNVCHVQGS